MKHVSPEYEVRLRDLAILLCPLKEVVEINPLSIPRDEFDYTYHPFQRDVEDTQTGFDILGDFHIIRTTGQNRWDSEGNYTVDI